MECSSAAPRAYKANDYLLLLANLPEHVRMEFKILSLIPQMHRMHVPE